MIAPLILLMFSSLGGLATFVYPAIAPFFDLSVVMGLISLFLLLRALWLPKVKAKHGGKTIVIDGSNVMHWDGGTPKIEAVRAVIAHLVDLGFAPGVVFDANAGHILTGRYRHHAAMASLLGLPEDRVMVVDKGMPADPIILAAASDSDAQIITNDRYRDWADTHKLVREPGRLVRGGFHEGSVWLDRCLQTPMAATP